MRNDDEWYNAKEAVKGMYEAQIKHLQKYEKIVKEMEEYLEPGMVFEIPEDMDIKSSRHIDIIKHTFYKIKEKYFPKPKDKCDNCRYKKMVKNIIETEGK